jgi:uncharacterized protein (TIGR02265 family)
MSDIPGRLINGVFNRVLADDVTPALVEALKPLGLDLSAPLRESYPRKTWYQALQVTAATLYPELSPDAQLRAMGRHIIHVLEDRGIVKGAWVTMARLMGPRRSLKQAAEFTARSPVRVGIEERTRNEFEVSIDADEQSEFFIGLLEATIDLLGGKDAHVEPIGPPGETHVFRVRWR